MGSAASGNLFHDLPDDQILAVMVEEAVVTVKRDVTEKVRISTITESTDSTVPADSSYTAVDVRRIKVGKILDQNAEVPKIRTEGCITIIPVFEERVVVETRIVVTEEIHVTRRTTTETVEIPVSLRRQRAVIERFSADGKIIATE